MEERFVLAHGFRRRSPLLAGSKAEMVLWEGTEEENCLTEADRRWELQNEIHLPGHAPTNPPFPRVPTSLQLINLMITHHQSPNDLRTFQEVSSLNT